MQSKLRLKDYLSIASMLFGIMFGAGNLIFPIHMGQEAGANVWLAILGFLISAIGLPFLAIVGMAVTRSTSVVSLASRVSKRFGVFFTVALYLVIGPFFAIPRLASTSFQIGIVPFLNSDQHTIALALYSLFFFGLAYSLSRRPGRILDYVGKWLNPAFLLVLGFLLLLVVINPMGDFSDYPSQVAYQANPFVKGVLKGYNTLDVLASLAYAIVVISAIKQLGITEPSQMARDMVKSGFISMGFMAVIYGLLAYAGATSLGQFALMPNGGDTLAQITRYYLGTFGSLVLALIIFLGCLKTAVGLLTAFSETFSELFPKFSYHTYLVVTTIFPMLFANVGLTRIISYSIPVLMFIYPLAIVLTLLALFEKWLNGKWVVYRWVILMTIFPAMLDSLVASPWAKEPWLEPLIGTVAPYLPFSSLGLGWIVPATLGMLIGLIHQRFSRLN